MFVVGIALFGCNTDEGLLKETRELVNAVEEGQTLDKIGKQAQDVVDAFEKQRAEVKEKINEADAFIAKARTELNKRDQQIDEKLAKLELQVQQAKQRIDGSGEIAADLEATLQRIEDEARALISEAEAEENQAEPAP